MRKSKLPVVALVVSCLALAFGGFALFRAYDANEGPQGPVPATSTTIPFLTVPPVYDLDAFSATQTLKNAGFKVTAQGRPSFSTAKGRVISQNPQAGERVQQGSTVEIDFSTGKPS